MGKLVEFRTIDLPELLLVGKEIRHSMEEQMKGSNPLPGLWDRCFGDGTFEALEKQRGFSYNPLCVSNDNQKLNCKKKKCNHCKHPYIGVMIDWDKGDGDFSYIVGMFMKPGAEIPEGFFSRKLDSVKVAVGWIEGKDVQDVCSNAHELTEQALKSNGFGNSSMKWCAEVYNCPRFTAPGENGEIILDYYIPIDL